MASYLAYHPQRQKMVLQGTVVYHDSLVGNQCPYVWNERFLHSFCHITQMSVNVGDIVFWVSGDTFPNFEYLRCDLVFCVESKLYWTNANKITRSDPIVDSEDAFRDHYSWAGRQHSFKRRRRYTLKAHSTRSWQPQVRGGALLDLVPKLQDLGLTISTLRNRLRAGFQAQPLRITDSQAEQLYSWIERHAPIKVLGRTLVGLSREVLRRVDQQTESSVRRFRTSRGRPTCQCS